MRARIAPSTRSFTSLLSMRRHAPRSSVRRRLGQRQVQQFHTGPVTWNSFGNYWNNLKTKWSSLKDGTNSNSGTEGDSQQQDWTFELIKKIAPSGIEFIVASLSQLEKAIGSKWTYEDLTIGLVALGRMREQQRRGAPPYGVASGSDNTVSLVQDPNFVSMLMKYGLLAEAAYARYGDKALAQFGFTDDNVLSSRWESAYDGMRPAYFVAVNENEKEIIVCIRGTKELADGLINLCMAPVELSNESCAHAGIARTSYLLLAEIQDILRQAVDDHPDYRLTFVGHSLGGAIASLLAMIVNERIPAPTTISNELVGMLPSLDKEFAEKLSDSLKPNCKVNACTFGTPSCVSPDLAQVAEKYITSCVHAHDVIPRFRLPAVERLRQDLMSQDWRSEILRMVTDEMKDNTMSARMKELQESVSQWKSRWQAGQTLDMSSSKEEETQKSQKDAHEFEQELNSTMEVLKSRLNKTASNVLQDAPQLQKEIMSSPPVQNLQQHFNRFRSILEKEQKILDRKALETLNKLRSYQPEDTQQEKKGSIASWRDVSKRALRFWDKVVDSEETQLYKSMYFVVPGKLFHVVHPTEHSRSQVYPSHFSKPEWTWESMLPQLVQVANGSGNPMLDTKQIRQTSQAEGDSESSLAESLKGLFGVNISNYGASQESDISQYVASQPDSQSKQETVEIAGQSFKSDYVAMLEVSRQYSLPRDLLKDGDYFQHVVISPYLIRDHSMKHTLVALKYVHDACTSHQK